LRRGFPSNPRRAPLGSAFAPFASILVLRSSSISSPMLRSALSVSLREETGKVSA